MRKDQLHLMRRLTTSSSVERSAALTANLSQSAATMSHRLLGLFIAHVLRQGAGFFGSPVPISGMVEIRCSAHGTHPFPRTLNIQTRKAALGFCSSPISPAPADGVRQKERPLMMQGGLKSSGSEMPVGQGTPRAPSIPRKPESMAREPSKRLCLRNPRKPPSSAPSPASRPRSTSWWADRRHGASYGLTCRQG